jgi:uridine kinase
LSLPEDLVMNAPERHEYAQALSALTPVLYNLPPKIIAIDGKSDVGKTKFGRYLAWRFNISLLESDLFLEGGQNVLKYRHTEIRNVIRSRIDNARRPVIIEGIVTLRLLRELHKKHDFHIHVICEQAEGGTALEADWKKYQKEFKPQDNADLVLDLPVLGH